MHTHLERRAPGVLTMLNTRAATMEQSSRQSLGDYWAEGCSWIANDIPSQLVPIGKPRYTMPKK